MHDGIEQAGYISFLAMLSIFPFCVMFMVLIGLIGQESLGYFLIELVLHSSWADFIDALKPRIIAIVDTPPQSLITLALISAIWTASSVFEALRTILNRAYHVTNTPPYILRRLLSVVEFFIAIAVCLIVISMVFVLPTLWEFLMEFSHLQEIMPATVFAKIASPQVSELRIVLATGFIFIIVSYLYRFLPNKKDITFHEVIPGTILCTSSWILFGQVFKFYLKNFPQVNFIYGSIAGVIISLLYFYFISLLFIIGAEFNYIISTHKNKKFGSKNNKGIY